MANLFDKKNPFDRARKNPPRVVTIWGLKLKVRVCEHLEADGDELLGAFNSETKTIFLLKGCTWRPVLFHEIIHAILYLSGTAEGLSIVKEESLVLALEHALFSFIKT